MVFFILPVIPKSFLSPTRHSERSEESLEVWQPKMCGTQISARRYPNRPRGLIRAARGRLIFGSFRCYSWCHSERSEESLEAVATHQMCGAQIPARTRRTFSPYLVTRHAKILAGHSNK